MAHPTLTQQALKSLLRYDPETGAFTWLHRRGSVKAGDEAGSVGVDGYLGIKVEGRRCSSHRLAWLYMTGCWPAAQIDHINRVKTDNRFCNLREATCSENHHNLGLMRTNKTGYQGVSFIKARGKFYASIKVMCKTRNLGEYDCAEDAAAAYATAKRELHTFSPAVSGAGARA